MNWRFMFPAAEVIALPPVGSDHCPLVLDTSPLRPKVSRSFVFEAFWTDDPECSQLISEVWKSADSQYTDFTRNVGKVTIALQRWSRRKFSNGHHHLLTQDFS